MAKHSSLTLKFFLDQIVCEIEVLGKSSLDEGFQKKDLTGDSTNRLPVTGERQPVGSVAGEFCHQRGQLARQDQSENISAVSLLCFQLNINFKLKFYGTSP